MQENPLISIIVASYNYEHFIAMALDSLLAQTYSNVEVVVVDDGSKDGSVAVVRSYEERDPRVHLFMHPGGENRGLAATIQRGMQECHGQYIAFCESDDLWTEDHLEQVMKALAQHPEAHIISCDVQTFGNPPAKWMRRYFRRLRAKLHEGMNVFNVRRHLNHNYVPTFSCVMIEAETLRSLDFCPPVHKWLDIWLYQQILCREALLHVPLPLTRWRIHGGSLNSNTKAPEVRAFYSGLHALLERINGPIHNDIYFRTHSRWHYLWYRLSWAICPGV